MDLFFERKGEGPAFIILHGLFGSSDNWRTVAKPFTESHSVYFVDQRNHGRSPHFDEHTMPSIAADLAAFMDEQGLQTATVLGHSMGGKVATYFALAYPERLEKLIVADMGIKRYAPGHNEIFEALCSVDFSKVEKRSDAEAQLKQHGIHPVTRGFLLKSMKRDKSGQYCWRFNLPVLESEYENILMGLDEMGAPHTSYDGPTLFVRGAKSDYVLDEDWPAIQQVFPSAELASIENAGHWLHAEQPQAFVETIQGWLALR